MASGIRMGEVTLGKMKFWGVYLNWEIHSLYDFSERGKISAEKEMYMWYEYYKTQLNLGKKLEN
jgi:hypothetical protein